MGGIIIRDTYLQDTSKDRMIFDVEDAREDVRDIEREIEMLIAADPSKMYEKDIEGNLITWMDILPMRIKELLGRYKEAVIREHLLEVANDDPENVVNDL